MDLVFAGLARPEIFDAPHGNPDAIPGVFQRVGFGNFPAGIPKVYVVLRIVGDPNDYGNHRLHVHFRDALGQQIGDALDKTFILTQERPRLQIVVPYEQLLIPQPGEYRFEVSIDGCSMKSVELHAIVGPVQKR